MIERFSKDTIIICTKLSTELKDLSDEAWLSGAVYHPNLATTLPTLRDKIKHYSDRDSDNAKIYTDGITVGKEYRVTERIGILPPETVSIINDWGSERYYLSDLFISKSEWRQNKLDILLGTTSS
jgi:hypothetical protein